MNRVFLSYCTKDVVLTRLIGHVLEQEGLSCFYSERDIPTGQKFEANILDEINVSDVFLVIWTSHAAVCAWVNQEIGVAIGKEIPVWPLVIDSSAIEGAISRNQGSLLSQEREPFKAIRRLAVEIKSGTKDRPFAAHVDHFLLGKEERTRQLINMIPNENPHKTGPYTLRLRAAFSCFAISGEPEYRVGGYHTIEYHDLLMQERLGVEAMLKWAEVRMILWPARPYDDAFMQIRFRNLLKFLETNKQYGRLRVAVGPFQGGNLYGFDDHLSVLGLKLPSPSRPGYDITTVSRHKPTVRGAIKEFDNQFRVIWRAHRNACGSENPQKIREHVISLLKGMAPIGAQR